MKSYKRKNVKNMKRINAILQFLGILIVISNTFIVPIFSLLGGAGLLILLVILVIIKKQSVIPISIEIGEEVNLFLFNKNKINTKDFYISKISDNEVSLKDGKKTFNIICENWIDGAELIHNLLDNLIVDKTS